MVLEIPRFVVNPGEVVGVIGPNGAGKTTFMMALSGLIEFQSGDFRFCGQAVHPHRQLAYRRNLAIVMQAPLLIDASVYENIAVGLRFRGISKKEEKQRIAEWLDRLGIAPLQDRPARALSGGEAQRVSLARAFVLQPEIILLDEPFSALDAPTRAQLVADLKGILSSSGTAAIFITHDLDEALMLSDRLAVLMQGQVRQIGTPQEIFSQPADPDVARFTGVDMVLPAQVIRQDQGLIRADCGGLVLEAVSQAPTGSPVYCCLRPEDLALSLAGHPTLTSARNSFPATIEKLIPQGPLVRVVLRQSIPLVSLVTRASSQEMGLKEGLTVWVSVKATAVHVIHKPN
jgi:tungstate transport system ATP-binding protein